MSLSWATPFFTQKTQKLQNHPPPIKNPQKQHRIPTSSRRIAEGAKAPPTNTCSLLRVKPAHVTVAHTIGYRFEFVRTITKTNTASEVANQSRLNVLERHGNDNVGTLEIPPPDASDKHACKHLNVGSSSSTLALIEQQNREAFRRAGGQARLPKSLCRFLVAQIKRTC